MADLVPSHITLRAENVKSLVPETNKIVTENGSEVSYDALVVAAGLKVNWDGITSLRKALADPQSGVSSIYSFDTADKTWSDIGALRTGKAIFTQPAGVIKCAGAPQVSLFRIMIPYTHLSSENHVDGVGSVPPHWEERKDQFGVHHWNADYV